MASAESAGAMWPTPVPKRGQGDGREALLVGEDQDRLGGAWR